MDEGLAKIRNARSKKDFPFLKLEDDEYVEHAFSRAKICLFMIFGGVTGGLALILLMFLMILLGQNSLDEMGRNFMYIILACLVATAVTIGLISYTVYRGNRLFVTNKHVIQMIMKSTVSTSVNTIDLSSIEDVSFHQDGLMQKIFGYGTFRLSTIGDETTYTFPFSDVTSEELRAVSKLVTEAKEKAKQKSK